MTDPDSLYCMRARYYNPYLKRFINADPLGLSASMNFYAFADGNPISYLDPFGMQASPAIWFYFGPATVVQPYGPNAFAAQESQAEYQARFNANVIQPIQTVNYGIAGVAVGAGTAGIATLAAPAAVTGLTALGVAETTASATVTTGLLLGAGYGTYRTVVNTAESVQYGTATGDWRPAAFNIGTIAGGALVGMSSGGRYLADTVGSGPSPAPPMTLGNFLSYELRNVYNPFHPNPNTLGWMASAPTPFSGGFAAAAIASGATSAGK